LRQSVFGCSKTALARGNPDLTIGDDLDFRRRHFAKLTGQLFQQHFKGLSFNARQALPVKFER